MVLFKPMALTIQPEKKLPPSPPKAKIMRVSPRDCCAPEGTASPWAQVGAQDAPGVRVQPGLQGFGLHLVRVIQQDCVAPVGEPGGQGGHPAAALAKDQQGAAMVDHGREGALPLRVPRKEVQAGHGMGDPWGMTKPSTAATWHMLPPSTNRCQMAWWNFRFLAT